MVTNFVMRKEDGVLSIETRTLKTLPSKGEYIQLGNGDIHTVRGVVHCLSTKSVVDVYLNPIPIDPKDHF